ncbi:MAG: hypothetical protein LBD99_01835 [Candidatus Margulisbacteria bacterium]|jgi:hypothetical protein|nr:hypothetical protein [Candidatus Margulisiibacteriota bacterium]
MRLGTRVVSYTENGFFKRLRRSIAAALLGPAILIGAVSCGRSAADSYRPASSGELNIKLSDYNYDDSRRLVYAGGQFVPQEHSAVALRNLLTADKSPLNYEKALGPRLCGALDDLLNDRSGQGFLVNIGDAYFIQDPSANNRIVSESVYWLRVAGGAHYLGVPAGESQALFDGLLRGMEQMIKLAERNGSGGEFPAWAARIQDGQLVLDTDTDSAGARNSASDADHDLVMALLVAVDNVERGIWTDKGYDRLLAKFIPALEKEYTVIGGLSVLQPSEDYRAKPEIKDFHLDYFSPETAFSIAHYLHRSGQPEQAKAWAQRGLDSLELLKLCLEQHNYIPAKAWISDDLRIMPAGRQGWDGIRAPARIAAGLRYLPASGAHSAGLIPVLQKYLRRWAEGYTVPELDAAVYLPLAAELGAEDTLFAVARVLADGMSDTAIYKENERYFQVSLIMKTCIELLFPYNTLSSPNISLLNLSGSSRLDERRTVFTLEQIAPEKGYYGQTSDGFGYVINNSPSGELLELQDALPEGYYIINSESLAYGFAQAVAEKNWPRVKALLKTIYYLSQKNYRETNQTTKLLPWAVFYNGQDFQIAQKDGISNYGNASASDADLLLLTAMIKAVEQGEDEQDLRNFIALYANEFIQRNIGVYYDRNNNIHLLLLSGGLIGPRFLDGDLVYKFYTSYPNYDWLNVIKDYFQQDGLYNTAGSAFYYAIFSQLLEDTQGLLKKIIARYPDPAQFPNVLELRAVRWDPESGKYGGLQLVEPDAQYPMETPDARQAALWRLPLNIGYNPGGAFSPPAATNYYTYYLQELAKIDFSSTTARFSINDAIYRNGNIHYLANSFVKHWKAGHLSPFYDSRYDVVDAVPDSSEIPSALAGYYQNKSQDYSYLRKFIEYALALAKSRDTAAQAVQVYEDTLLKYLSKDDLKSAKVQITLAPVDKLFDLGNIPALNLLVEKSAIDLVDEYLSILTSMLGYNSEQLLQKINLLLLTAELNNYPPDNPVLRALYLQKIMLWSSLSPLDRSHLRLISARYAEYGDDLVYDYFANPPVKQNELRRLILEWGEYRGDNKIDTLAVNKTLPAGAIPEITDYKLTPQKLSRMEIPRSLKMALIKELVKRDVQSILARNTGDLETALSGYINNLPQEYQMQGFVPVLFAETETIPARIKRDMIDRVLAGIDRSSGTLYGRRYDLASADGRREFNEAYNNYYVMLWSAYKLALYQEANSALKFLNNEDNQKNARAEMAKRAKSLNAVLPRLLQMIDIIQQTGIQMPAAYGDALVDAFAAKYYADIYLDYRQNFAYMDTLADFLNNIYWLGYDLERLASGAATRDLFSKENAELYAQLRPAVYSLIAMYKNYNPNWRENNKLVGVIERITLQEEANIDNIKDTLAKLADLQKNALLYGQLEEYAYYKVSEAYIYAAVTYYDTENGVKINGLDLYNRVLEDEYLDRYDYMVETVRAMAEAVQFRYAESDKPPPRRRI